MWRNIARFTGLVILAVEIRQVLIGRAVDQGLLLLAAGLCGIPSMIRGGNGHRPFHRPLPGSDMPETLKRTWCTSG